MHAKSILLVWRQNKSTMCLTQLICHLDKALRERDVRGFLSAWLEAELWWQNDVLHIRAYTITDTHLYTHKHTHRTMMGQSGYQ